MQLVMPGEEGSVKTLCYRSMFDDTLCPSPLLLQIYKFDDLRWKNDVLYPNNTVMVFNIASDVIISSFLLLFFLLYFKIFI